jgi:hypothetical protein
VSQKNQLTLALGPTNAKKHCFYKQNVVKVGCCFGGLRNQPKSQNAIKTHGISTIAWQKLSVGIKNVEITKDQ